MSVFFADANHMIGLETYLLYKRPSDEDSSKLSDVQPNTTEIAPKSSQVPPNMTKRPKGLPKPNPIPDPSRRASLRASYDQMPAKTEDESSETELNFQKCESAPLRRESERGSRDEMKRFRSLNDKNVSSKPLTPVKKDEETAARAAEEQEEEEEKENQTSNGIDFYKQVSHHSVSESLAEVLRLSHFDWRHPQCFYCQLHPWVFKKVEKNVSILEKIITERNYVCIASIGFIPFSMDTVWNFIKKPENRLRFDRLVTRIEVKDKISEDMEVIQLEMRVRQCFRQAAREFLVLTTQRQLGTRRLLCSKSIDFTMKYKPFSKNISRGNLRFSAFQVEPFQSGTKMTFVLQVDFSGIPNVVRDYVLLRQALCIHYISVQLQQQKRRLYT